MAKFCSDVDLLKYEAGIFNDTHRPSQVLCQGNDGVKNGVTYTSATAAFIDSGITAGHVIYLRDTGSTTEGRYEIVSVDSQTQLTISVVRCQSDDPAIAPPPTDQPDYWITTCDPQIEEASDMLLRRFGITDSDGISVEDILNLRELRTACAFAVLATVYGSLAESGDGSIDYWAKAHHYQGLFQLARTRLRIKIDTDNDGIAECVRRGDTIRLCRQ